MSLLIDRLDQIAGWVCTELETVITNQVTYTDKTLSRISTDDEVPLSFNDHASDFAYDLLGTLRNWTNYVANERALPWPGDGRAPHFARWLIRHAYDLARTEQARLAYDQIISLYDAAFKIVDRPPTRTRTINDEQLAEARKLELNAKTCADMARTMGAEYSNLTKRRVLHLVAVAAVVPLRHVKAGRWESPILRLGDVLDAHLTWPTADERSTA
ncbi:hypothetical protein F8M49_30025 [Rhodococcus zopfii]|uniref:Uncharacterized protein n=1 Tax=Rhodococcus zopfii TaxID=43772 RepID=A0ABU3WJQ7_9NOCA|nr:hypothetical protein [Rhodococcus zopfii]MDV2478600.1 hypothetical protein [Rhodococcus zopfii]